MHGTRTSPGRPTKKFRIIVGVTTMVLLSSCGDSAVKKDWDVLSESEQATICDGVAQFGADTAAGLEYTPNSEYTKDDLAAFLQGEC